MVVVVLLHSGTGERDWHDGGGGGDFSNSLLSLSLSKRINVRLLTSNFEQMGKRYHREHCIGLCLLQSFTNG